MTSNTMVGADADELDLLAQEFRTSAENLDGRGDQLTTVIKQMPWFGGDATQFTGEWTKKNLPTIRDGATFLRELADHLVQQASDQRMTSSAATGAISFQLTPEQVQALDQLDDVAHEMTRGSSDEQLAWWNSLSPEEQALLLDQRPGLLMNMDGLPADVRDEAQVQYLADVAADVVVSTSDYEFEFNVSIPGTGLGAGAQIAAEKTVYADGSVDVEISGGPELAAGLVVAGADGGPLGTLTYHFDSQKEADDFLAGLRNTVSPLSMLPFGGPSPVEFLRENGSKLLRPDSLGGGVQGSAGAVTPYGFASVDASVIVERNSDSSYTLTASGQLSGGVEVPNTLSAHAAAPNTLERDWSGVGDQAVGSVSGSASLNVGSDGDPRSLTLTYDTTSGTSSGAHGVFEASHSNTTGSSTSIEFDLTDPAVAAQLKPIVNSVVSGHPEIAFAQVASAANRAQLVESATVTHSTYTGESYQGSGDFVVASASGSHSTTTATSVTVKSPGGDTQQLIGENP